MSRVSKAVYHVQHARNSGSPTGGDSYGDRASIVVSEWESHLHGKGKQTGEVRRSKGMEGCEMLPSKSLSILTGNTLRKKDVNHKPVGEPDVGKLTCPVREGDVGKGQECTSLASYFMPTGDGEIWVAFLQVQWPPPRGAPEAGRSASSVNIIITRNLTDPP